jgi:hypothetical protein
VYNVRVFDWYCRSYDVAPDGRFAMIAIAGGPPPSQDPRGIVVVQNTLTLTGTLCLSESVSPPLRSRLPADSLAAE